jgi:phage anti-repressor protein
MCKLIDTRGLNIEDIKVALIANDEVVDSRDYSSLLVDYGILLAICCKAQDGNNEAKEYLQKGVTERFKDFVPDNHKEYVLKQANQFLGIEETNLLSKDELINQYRLHFNHLLALTVLAAAGHEKAIKYINEKSEENFEINMSDLEKKDFLTDAIFTLNRIYPDNK